MIKVTCLSYLLAPFPDAGVAQFFRVEEWCILFAYVFQLPLLNGLHDGPVLSPFFGQHVGGSVSVNDV